MSLIKQKRQRHSNRAFFATKSVCFLLPVAASFVQRTSKKANHNCIWQEEQNMQAKGNIFSF